MKVRVTVDIEMSSYPDSFDWGLSCYDGGSDHPGGESTLSVKARWFRTNQVTVLETKVEPLP
jgi:hypothetical protein